MMLAFQKKKVVPLLSKNSGNHLWLYGLETDPLLCSGHQYYSHALAKVI